jgi:hypothetical protein
MVSSAVIVCASDAVSQLKQVDMKNYDFRRTLVVGIGYGGLFFAPLLHGITTTWARILPSTSAPAIVFKTVIDMTTSFPVNLTAMVSLQALVRKEDPIAAVKKNLVPSVVAGWGFWPFMNIAMYKVIFCNLDLLSFLFPFHTFAGLPPPPIR